MDAPNLLRLVFGDAHRIAGKVEDCDTAKVERFVGVAIERQAAEVIGNGDNADTTRDRDAVETAGEYFGRVMGRPFARAGIPVVFGAGNHDPWGHLAGGRFLRALIQSGFDPQLVSLASGPIQRGRWVIGHGHPLDPSCCGGPHTKVGEVATRVDHVLDQVGVDIELGRDRLARLPGVWPAPHRAHRTGALHARHCGARHRLPLLQLHPPARTRLRGNYCGKKWRFCRWDKRDTLFNL